MPHLLHSKGQQTEQVHAVSEHPSADEHGEHACHNCARNYSRARSYCNFRGLHCPQRRVFHSAYFIQLKLSPPRTVTFVKVVGNARQRKNYQARKQQIASSEVYFYVRGAAGKKSAAFAIVAICLASVAERPASSSSPLCVPSLTMPRALNAYPLASLSK